MTLIEEFIKNGILDVKQSVNISKEVHDNNKSIDEILIDVGIDEEKITSVKKEYFKDVPYFEDDMYDSISNTVLQYIPVESAERYKIIPLGLSPEGKLKVGMLNPEDLNAKTILQFISTKINKPYEIHLISLEYYNYVIKNYRGVKGAVSKALDEYTDSADKELKKFSKKKDSRDLNDAELIKEDAPVAKIVSNIIKGAAQKQASDIHIEVDDKEMSVRYRVDGVMRKDLTLPKNIHRAIVARIKILSRIKIDEKRKPQDGRFSGNFLNRKIDFRVSTLPTYYGEKVVMRLLEQDRGALPIEEIGFSEENLKKIKAMVKNSYGIILVCGPTGSGKTNTLYSLLNEIDKETFNVISLEDPIELNIPGVSQSQVRPDIGYTFGFGLRSILRQDPDIIMVGEIRDKETASLAIEAALTGHLVISTIHTNTAADVPQRLVDMGVAPYLIGPTLIATIGQRLIRKIVPELRVEADMDLGIRKFIEDNTEGLSENIRREFLLKNKIYKTKTDELNVDGMKGRTAVFEILEMDDELKRIIITDPSSISIFAAARKKGFITFKEDGIKKALDGVTTFDEVMKL